MRYDPERNVMTMTPSSKTGRWAQRDEEMFLIFDMPVHCFALGIPLHEALTGYMYALRNRKRFWEDVDIPLLIQIARNVLETPPVIEPQSEPEEKEISRYLIKYPQKEPILYFTS